MGEKAMEATIRGKYIKKDYIFPNIYNNLFEVPQLILLPIEIEVKCYEVEINGNLYEIVTDKDSDFPIGAKIRIEKKGRLFKEPVIIFENRKYSVKNLNKVTSR
jgi:hypothetical protein